MINFQYVRPSSQKSAIDIVTKDNKSQFIAGGTNLVDLMKRGVTAPEKLVDINALPLNNIEAINGSIRIGALALNSTVAENEKVISSVPLLSLALKAGASPQLRNMATVGGNMMQRTRCQYFYDTVMPCNKRQPGTGCSALKGYNRMHAIFGTSEQCIAVHPSDMCIALAALDATVIVSGPKADRRIAFTDFHRLPGTHPEKDNNLEPGELITGIEIPDNGLYNKNVYYLKVRDRTSYAFALVSVAAALEMNGNTIKSARIALGGVAHKPWRLYDLEKALAGADASEDTINRISQMAIKDARSYGYNDFKLKMVPASIQEALNKAIAVK